MRKYALLRESAPCGQIDAQCAEALWSVWRQSKEAVQGWMSSRVPVKVTREVRCYVFGHRCHHGLTGAGCVIVGTVLRRFEFVLFGAALCLHDKEDWPWPMTKQ